jgi:hypothetical protein
VSEKLIASIFRVKAGGQQSFHADFLLGSDSGILGITVKAWDMKVSKLNVINFGYLRNVLQRNKSIS